MHQEHPAFEKPEDRHCTIWRYMSFAKLLSLLETKALWFSRLDKLDDAFEGRYSDGTFLAYSGADSEGMQKLKAAYGDISDTSRGMLFVNCWHMNEYECALLWHLYGTEGVAIRSTCLGLERSFDGTATPVYLGCVSYIDYDMTAIPRNNIFYLSAHKRRQFQNEHELRAVVLSGDAGPETPGEYVNVDLNMLIRGVYVNPRAPLWFTELVQSKLDAHRIPQLVLQSRLADEPDG